MTNDSVLSSTGPISEAVILMAGSGSRLRASGLNLAKPLILIHGRPLISYTIDALVRRGIKIVHAVVGFESESLMAEVRPLIPPTLEVRFIINRDWKKQNGISVLAAADRVQCPFLLTMSDHVFENAIIERLLDSFAPSFLNIAVDRKLDSVFDPDDAMKVQTRGNDIVDIGKKLRDYDAIDIGLFISPTEIFDYLERARSDSSESDCSLADGIQLMTRDNKVRAMDIGGSWWQDVDTLQMLQHAERLMAKRTQSALT